MIKDYIIRATAAQGSIRAFAATTTNMVGEAQRIHGLYPVASAALGRLMTAAVMMSIDLKGENDELSINMNGGGSLGSLIVVSNSKGRIKGYVTNPYVDLSLNPQGKLDVATAMGKEGKITVIKDLRLKKPYIGQVELISGEIGDDIAYYLTVSEQQPSAVGLGVLVNPDATIKASGGFILQPMPGASESIISELEMKLGKIPPISSQIDSGMTPEQILEGILGEYDLKINASLEPYYLCDCSRRRLESVLLSLGEAELRDIIEKDEGAELTCHYCSKVYSFNKAELEELLKEAKAEN